MASDNTNMPSVGPGPPRAVVGLVLMVVAYFAIPVERGIDAVELVVGSVISAIGILVAVPLVGWQARRQLEEDESPLSGLVISIVAAVQLVFNVVVIATAASILTRQLERRLRQRGDQPPDAG